jgi:hypothetical protein
VSCIILGISGLFIQHKYTAKPAEDSAINSERY